MCIVKPYLLGRVHTVVRRVGNAYFQRWADILRLCRSSRFCESAVIGAIVISPWHAIPITQVVSATDLSLISCAHLVRTSDVVHIWNTIVPSFTLFLSVVQAS
jgi:hypothetical protein